jgi:hypothetical protein
LFILFHDYKAAADRMMKAVVSAVRQSVEVGIETAEDPPVLGATVVDDELLACSFSASSPATKNANK